MTSIIKKLQVFISSTYLDLKDERQAAVSAILASSHIPAGMELFTAGDKSQLETIYDWITESDAYLLILGGRYGSIEPQSGKSFTQLEYEHALKSNKPLFALVIEDEALEDKIKKEGSSVFERENVAKYKAFKKIVLSRVVKFFKDERDIKLAILEKMNEFSRRNDIAGWVKSSDIDDVNKLTGEIIRVNKENQELHEKLHAFTDKDLIMGLTFNELSQLVSNTPFEQHLIRIEFGHLMNSTYLGNNLPTPNDAVIWLHTLLSAGEVVPENHQHTLQFMRHLREIGIVDGRHIRWLFTKDGSRYVLRLKADSLRRMPA